MRGVAGDQHAAPAILSRLSRRVGEARNPGGRMDAVVRTIDGDERSAEIVKIGLVARPITRSVTRTPIGP